MINDEDEGVAFGPGMPTTDHTASTPRHPHHGAPSSGGVQAPDHASGTFPWHSEDDSGDSLGRGPREDAHGSEHGGEHGGEQGDAREAAHGSAVHGAVPHAEGYERGQ